MVALPEQDVFLRVIETPYMEPKELRNFVTLGAEEYIPLPLNEVTFDAQIIGDKEEMDEKKEAMKAEGHPAQTMNALLVASKNEVLSRYVDLIKKAGLTPKGIEPETLSIERVLGDTKERPSATIIVNIGF